jgi:hypothetical protein
MSSDGTARPARLADLSDDRRALAEALLARRAAATRQPPLKALPRTGQAGWPLTYQQEELWFLQQFVPESTSYNVPVVWRLHGAVDPEHVAAAINQVVRRHEVLRTRFVERDGWPVQVVDPPAARRLRVRHVRDEAVSSDQLRLQCDRPFDLAGSGGLRPVLLRHGDRDSTLLLDLHHIVFDEWSETILWRDFSTYYREARGLPAPPLPDLAVQLVDYAQWQRDSLTGDRLDRLNTFWRDRLTDLPTLAIPTDRTRPRRQSFEGSVYWFSIDPAHAAVVTGMGRAVTATPHMCYLAVFGVLLARWTGQPDLAVGTITSGRTHPALRDLIGFFVNTVVLRLRLAAGMTFPNVLAQTRQTVLDAYEHEFLPFVKVVEAVRPPREPDHHPLFQVMFTYESADAEETRELPGATVSPDGVTLPVARFDLVLNISESNGRIDGGFEFNTTLFDRDTIALLASTFTDLMAEIAADHNRVLVSPTVG